MNHKKILPVLFLFFASALYISAAAQDGGIADRLKITGGGTFFKPKIMPNLTSLALAQVTVDFKTMSTKSVTKREKKSFGFGKTPGKAATASVTAYLETTDGDLEAKDYQEIVDHFYSYFQHKLKENGIDTVSWDAITGTEMYKDAEPTNNAMKSEGGNAWVSYSAHNGNEISNGNPTFGFGKQKKIGRTSEDLNAPVAFIYTSIDFAAIDVDVDVRSGYKSTWTPNASQTTTMKSETKVSALMRVGSMQENFSYSTLMNEKLNAENVNVETGILAEMDYATGLAEDPDRVKKKSKIFSVALSKKMESNPVVISTTKEKYKAAAKKALENFADTFIAKAKVMKKG